jgi:ABC-type amino acid transport substrate-binding protein
MNLKHKLPRTGGFRIWLSFLCVAMVIKGAAQPIAVNAQTRLVRVGVYQNEPKIFMDNAGRSSGFFVELLEKIALLEGWTLVYVPCQWADCLQALEDGQIDLMPDVAYSTERDVLFDFHTIPVIESWSRIYASPLITINKLSDLDGKRIALLKGSIQQTVFQQLMDGFGYHVSLVLADSFEQAFTFAGDGSADAAVSNQLFGDYFYQQFGLSKTTIDFDPVALYYATAQGLNPDLLEAIDRDLGMWIPEPDSPYYSTLGDWSPKEPYRLPGYIFWVIAGVLGLLLFSGGMIFLLRRQVKVRTNFLEQANAELKNSEQRYHTLARISPVGIFRANPDGATSCSSG